nr:uncharacterized protein LOC128687886 [Cherax quadricarinatus]XP_053631430.1 uncharacterized protein LOC128687886 [Cherax quadricarinatus]
MPQSLIKEEHVLAALTTDRGVSAQLISWSLQKFIEAGENATSFVICVQVEFSQNGKKERTNYIAKLNPLRGENWTDFMRMAFKKEIRFYNEIEPALTSQLKNGGLDALKIPRCFFASLQQDKEIILQEDLRAQGFQKYDRRKTMDISHATVVLQEMARFHASSFLLQAAESQDFHLKYDYLFLHWSNYKPKSGETYRVVMADSLDNARVLLETVDGYGRAAEWVESIKPRVLNMFKEHTTTTPPFSSVCHFDLVNNNFLFRYDEPGDPVDVRILDFQMCYVASLATDIAEFFYTCLSSHDRKTHLDRLLFIYFASFSNVLKASGKAIPFTYKELQDEYKAKFLYGVVAAICKLPIIVAEEDEIPDMDSYVDQKTFSNTQQSSMITMIQKYNNFQPRFLSIFKELNLT